MSTPQSYFTIKSVAHVVEKRHKIKRKGKIIYYNMPNYPMHLSHVDALSIRKEVQKHSPDELSSMHESSPNNCATNESDSMVLRVDGIDDNESMFEEADDANQNR